jgi:flavin-dependent dehydrogenase
LCTKPDAPYPTKHYFSNFFKHKITSQFLDGTHILQKTAGVIPLGAIKKTSAPNTMLVGDAAAQVKPSSGGGIYTGLLCASRCVSVGLDALDKNDFSQKTLERYHKLWSSDIGREFYLGMKFRAILKRLNDDQLDRYIQKFQNPKIIDTISKYGDIDYPSKLIKPLLKKAPSLLKLIPGIIKEK